MTHGSTASCNINSDTQVLDHFIVAWSRHFGKKLCVYCQEKEPAFLYPWMFANTLFKIISCVTRKRISGIYMRRYLSFLKFGIQYSALYLFIPYTAFNVWYPNCWILVIGKWYNGWYVIIAKVTSGRDVQERKETRQTIGTSDLPEQERRDNVGQCVSRPSVFVITLALLGHNFPMLLRISIGMVLVGIGYDPAS